MTSIGAGRLALMLGAAVVLGACAAGDMAQDMQGAPAPARMVERDIEAPEVFSVSDRGLWDGRPSLGGVWVAHGSVSAPERVIIRNETNGNSVIGALFKREASNPGPAIQVSSDAAEALGMLAGAPAPLNVVALTRAEVTAPAEPAAATDTAIEAQTLASAAVAAVAPAARPETPAAPQTAPARPWVQIGIFSIEANAERTATMLDQAGITHEIRPGNSSGKAFWRVIAGPSASASEQADILARVKALGFADAYSVSN